MPTFNVAAPAAKLRVVNQSKGFQQWASIAIIWPNCMTE
jgi:hypothetical protein